jgi:GTPase SAR1 family protein
MASKETKPLSRRKQARLSRLIDRELDQKARGQEHIIKILIFGTDGSGRSTLYRAIAHQHNQADQSTPPQLIASIHSVCLHAIKTLSEISDISNPEILTAKKAIDNVPSETLLDEKLGESIHKVWRDENVQSTYTSSNWTRQGRRGLEKMKKANQAIKSEIEEVQLGFKPEIMGILFSYVLEQGAFVNSGYFLDRIRDITKQGFVPEFDSLIRTPPLGTNGINELSFKTGFGNFTVCDVSGQKK